MQVSLLLTIAKFIGKDYKPILFSSWLSSFKHKMYIMHPHILADIIYCNMLYVLKGKEILKWQLRFWTEQEAKSIRRKTSIQGASLLWAAHICWQLTVCQEVSQAFYLYDRPHAVLMTVSIIPVLQIREETSGICSGSHSFPVAESGFEPRHSLPLDHCYSSGDSSLFYGCFSPLNMFFFLVKEVIQAHYYKNLMKIHT